MFRIVVHLSEKFTTARISPLSFSFIPVISVVLGADSFICIWFLFFFSSPRRFSIFILWFRDGSLNSRHISVPYRLRVSKSSTIVLYNDTSVSKKKKKHDGNQRINNVLSILLISIRCGPARCFRYYQKNRRFNSDVTTKRKKKIY